VDAWEVLDDALPLLDGDLPLKLSFLKNEDPVGDRGGGSGGNTGFLRAGK
jgi:hypothetical protein